MLTSEKIAEHVQAFLDGGGTIEVVPFLKTKRASNPDVRLYKRIHRHGNIYKTLDWDLCLDIRRKL